MKSSIIIKVLRSKDISLLIYSTKLEVTCFIVCNGYIKMNIVIQSYSLNVNNIFIICLSIYNLFIHKKPTQYFRK